MAKAHTESDAGIDRPDWLIPGAGLCLTFGWVYFPAALSWMITANPTAFSGTFLSGAGISVFSAALVAGIVCTGFLAKRLAVRNHRLPRRVLHAGALILGMAALTARGTFPLLSVAMLAFAAAASGVYWFSRILMLPPLSAGVGLTWAAVLTSILTAVIPSAYADFLLPMGILLGFVLSGAEDRVDDTTVDRTKGEQNGILQAVMIAAVFFSQGSIASAGAPPDSVLDLFSLPVGQGLAVAVCLRGTNAFHKPVPFAIGMTVVSCVCLILFPRYDAVSSVLQGAAGCGAVMGLAGIAARVASPYLRAGCSLAGMCILTNAGGALSAAVTRTGYPAAGVLGVVAVACGTPLLYSVYRWRRYSHRSEMSLDAATAPHEPETTPNAWSGLTPRENEVCRLLIKGTSNPEICQTLFVSPNTVRTHMKNIYQKTGAHGREDLIALLQKDASPSSVDPGVAS